MAEIDPVILELRAEMGRYRADLKASTDQTNRNFARMERDAQRLEKQMLKSSTAIGNSFRTLAGSLAAAFSLSQIQQLADGYTRFQNSLKVTGLEGEKLAGTQEKLFQIAQKYGVQLESVGSLYGRAAQSQDALGASSADLLNVSEAVSASLKILPADAGAVSGAMTQLGQAFSSPRVQAEEFNSIVDVLTPLMQEAAKHIEGTGGTLAGLKQKLKDVKGEGVSNVELFRAITASLAEMQAKAASADQTIGQSLTKLNNALGLYIGQTDDSLSATERLAGGIEMLADNLGTVIPVLASVIALIGVQYVAAAGRAVAGNIALAASATGSAASMGALGAASFAMQARLAGAATSMQAAAFAARGLGGSLLALAGGPYGALIALGAGLAYVIATTEKSGKATAAYARIQDEAKAQTEKSADAADRLASAHGKVRAEALALAKAERELTRQKLASAQASLIQAEAELIRAKAKAQESAKLADGGGPGEGVRGRVSTGQQRFNTDRRAAGDADANVKAAEGAVIGLMKALNNIDAKIDAAAPPPVAAVGTGKPDKKTRAGSQEDPRDAQFRNDQELRQLQLEEIRAKEQAATAATERAKFAREALDLEALMRRKDIDEAERKKTLTAEEAKARRRVIDNLYGASDEIVVQGREAAYQAAITREEQQAIARQQTDAMRDELDALGAEAGVTDVRKARVEIERRMLEIQQQIERKLLDEAIARGEVADAAAARGALGRKQGAERTGFEKDNKGPLGQYMDDVQKVGLNIDDQFESIAVNGLQSLNDGLTDAIMNSKSLGDVFKNVAKQIIADLIRVAIQQTIVNALMSAFGGGGGGDILGGLSIGNSGGGIKSLGKTPGRASGGYVGPGQTVRVNEHAGGVELLRMGSQGGTVVPLGQANARAARSSQPTIIQPIINVDARGAVMNDQFAKQILSQANQNAVQVAGQVGKATLAAMPGRMASYQRDGT